MRIHHLNCISTCPVGGRLMDERARTLVERGELSCHCLLVETPEGLALIDTGLGLGDVRAPRERLSAFFLMLVAPDFREEMTAVRQVVRLGFDPRDVRHVVLSHLDFDHAGGLDDFPHATVHLMERERETATARESWLDRMRYRPQQWGTRDRWRTHTAGEGEPWLGFDAVRPIEGLRDEVLLVPLVGHTLGHAGVAVRGDRGWVLLAADAYFHHDELHPDRPRCPPGLRLYQRLMEKDRRARLANQDRLRALRRVHGDEVTVFCSHDPVEFERAAGRSTRVPAHALAAPALAAASIG